MTNKNTYKCPVCNGKPVPNEVVDTITFTNCICEFCQGKKYVTWLEAVFGVDPKYRHDLLDALTRAFDYTGDDND